MPNRIETLDRVLQAGITAVIRANSSEHLSQVADALKAGGVECIEVTMTTPWMLRRRERRYWQARSLW